MEVWNGWAFDFFGYVYYIGFVRSMDKRSLLGAHL